MTDTNSFPARENDRPRRRREWLILLLALLMSFSCVFCSTWLALSSWPDRMTSASMLTKRQADYSGGPDEARFARLDPRVGAEAATDIARLYFTPTHIQGDTSFTIAMLPATPTPTPKLGPPPALPQVTSSTPTPVGPDTATPAATAGSPVTGTPGSSPTPVGGTATGTSQPTTTPAGTPSLVPTATPVETPSPAPTLTPASTPTSAPPPPTAGPTSNPRPTTTPIPPDTPTVTPIPSNTPTAIPILPNTPTATAAIAQISGRFFEDTDYNGGNGAAFGGADVGLPNVQVELYNGPSLIGATTTDASGSYAFSNVPNGVYTIRAVSASIGDTNTPPGAGFNPTFTSAVAEQTYEHNGISGNGGAGALGGNDPAVSDLSTGSGAGVGDTNILVSVSGVNVSGVDFGFVYNLVANPNDANQGSLRQALLNANAINGTGTIVFSLAGTATIQPVSALPDITDPVIINGTSQPGFAGSPIVELNGTNSGGLVITAGNSTVQGLVINRAAGDGILIRNPSSTRNVIRDNYIGTDTTGTMDLGNGGAGIHLFNAPDNIISGNLISGNNSHGIWVHNPQARGIIQDNFIGTDVTGTALLGNGGQGILIDNSSNTLIGGTGNIIAGNGSAGVGITGNNANNTIQGNSIYANGGLGIDLEVNGVTLNDPGDGDNGTNELMNFPVIYTATILGTDVTITGEARLNAVIEFFIAAPDPSGYGEGQTFIGRRTVTADPLLGPGTVDPTVQQFSFIFSAGSLASGDSITATATDNAGNTSEFAGNVIVN